MQFKRYFDLYSYNANDDDWSIIFNKDIQSEMKRLLRH